ncbi:MAG TPA: pyridoxamine 5'-phosphate oxidase family protein [Streptosporangiaceae bacterium]|jgi:hypothetical protein|nr:pyridoxamine 5'-phosphate oxidase family protein [Streptosporangiaceae bacterium]
MPDDQHGPASGGSPDAQRARTPTIWDPEVEQVEEAECLRLIAGGRIGRLAYSSPSGVAIIPVGYELQDGHIMFPTPLGSPTDQDLRTGIADAAYHVAFEVDEFDIDAQEGWTVYIQGAASHVGVRQDGTIDWSPDADASADSQFEHFLCISPTRMAGRRLSRH